MHSPKYQDMKIEQERTLKSPVLKPNCILRFMYITMDIIYGSKPSLFKCKVIEILARYPYWSWELGAYKKISSRYLSSTYQKLDDTTEMYLRHINMGREAQDNEQWHLMIIEDIIGQKKIPQPWLKATFLPSAMVFFYFIICRLIYYIRPEWQFAMNALFESHAEHEYMRMVKDNPSWETESIDSAFYAHYPKQKTMADLFRRIGLDEREHMQDSLVEYKNITGKDFISQT